MVRPIALVVLASADAALRRRVVPIASDGLTVGRVEDEGVNFPIDDKLLSRRHATIAQLGRGPVQRLTDHQSRNGSFVDGARVQKANLHVGAVLRLGISVFVVDRDDREGLPDVKVGTRDRMLGQSRGFVEIRNRLDELATKDGPVVLTGEPGTGKSLAAGHIHREGERSGQLAVVGCRGAGVPLTARDLVGEHDGPAGYFASALDGTLVLEEVDLLAPVLQELLADTLSSGTFQPVGSDAKLPFNARVIASTSASLETALEAGAFSQRLYDLLGGERIEMTPLRERRVDIPLLAKHFLELEEPDRTFDWSPTFLEKLLVHDWPSNSRELRNVMRRLTMVEEDVTTLRSAHLPKELRTRVHMPSEDALRASAITVHVAPSREELKAMLERYEGDVQRVADHFAKDRRHVYRWLTRHDLSAADFRKPLE